MAFVPGDRCASAQIPQTANPPSSPAANAIAARTALARVIEARIGRSLPSPAHGGGQTHAKTSGIRYASGPSSMSVTSAAIGLRSLRCNVTCAKSG